MKKLLLTTVVIGALAASVPAGADTFQFSALNVNGLLGSRPPISHVCPCYDPVSGTEIFYNRFGGQINPWTVGTSTITSFSGKMYIPSGSTVGIIPQAQTIGNFNSVYAGFQDVGTALGFTFSGPTLFNSVDVAWLSTNTGAQFTLYGYLISRTQQSSRDRYWGTAFIKERLNLKALKLL